MDTTAYLHNNPKTARIMLVAGARPNFMKIAPVRRALHSMGIPSILVHTGQHYDPEMSDVFFTDLQMKRPEISLGIGAGSHGEQTGRLLIALEKAMVERQPDLVVVVGDVNSTLAGALTAAKLQIPVAHVEAGLRSNDWTMPEEVNRVVVDRLSRLLFTPSPDADDNLLAEGVEHSRILMVGNVMIDSLLRLLPRAREMGVPERLGLPPTGYAVCTLHRPAAVDVKENLRALLEALAVISRRIPVVFPLHPRTRAKVEGFGLEQILNDRNNNFFLTPPMGYLEFTALMASARVVLTDSGGLQEETTVLGIPCLTMRENTERPITLRNGTNRLVGLDPDQIIAACAQVLDSSAEHSPRANLPIYWDGRAGERVALHLMEYLERRG